MNFAKLDEFMDSMPKRGFPHTELIIAKDGKTVYHKAVGESADSAEAPQKDIYWIFSATKVITCIAAMRLVEDGVISLDDPVSKFIPEYKNLFVKQKDGTLLPAENELTVEHLFTMTGGYSYDFTVPEIQNARRNTPTTLGIVRSIAGVPLNFEPGTHFGYSLCHDILAGVVEIASGMKFSEYLSKIIFKPLGITDMGFFPNESQKLRFIDMYGYKNGSNTPIPGTVNNPFCFTEEYESGGAGLFATAKEYIKILGVIANGGTTDDGYTLLRPETIAMMGKNRLCEDALNDFVTTRLYGYGWGLCGRAHMDREISLSRSAVGEFGWDGAAGAFVLVDPENKLALYFGMHIMGCAYAYHLIHPTVRDLAYECVFDGQNQ